MNLPLYSPSAPGSRAQLEAAGIDVACCAVPGCPNVGSDDVQFHHIVRRATRVTGRFDLHAAENLVPLCRHHHGIADRLRPPPSALRSPVGLRPWLIHKVAATVNLSDAEDADIRPVPGPP